MLNKIKSVNPLWIKMSVVVLVLLAFLIYAVPVVRNTFEAYDIIGASYTEFNYPNTIKVHSCNIQFNNDKELDIKATMAAKISAENAYGQRSYDTFTGSSSFSGPNHHLTSLDWYEENMEYMCDFYLDLSKKNNVFIPLLNFMIGMDW